MASAKAAYEAGDFVEISSPKFVKTESFTIRAVEDRELSDPVVKRGIGVLQRLQEFVPEFPVKRKKYVS